MTKAALEQIARQGTVRVLKIGGPKIDDQTLGIVATMRNLVGLCLDNCDISDVGLKKLDRLSPEDLALHECPKVTDRGLEVLANYDGWRETHVAGRGGQAPRWPDCPIRKNWRR